MHGGNKDAQTPPHMSVMPVVTGFSTRMPTRCRSGCSTASASPSMMAWGGQEGEGGMGRVKGAGQNVYAASGCGTDRGRLEKPPCCPALLACSASASFARPCLSWGCPLQRLPHPARPRAANFRSAARPTFKEMPSRSCACGSATPATSSQVGVRSTFPTWRMDKQQESA